MTVDPNDPHVQALAACGLVPLIASAEFKVAWKASRITTFEDGGAIRRGDWTLTEHSLFDSNGKPWQGGVVRLFRGGDGVVLELGIQADSQPVLVNYRIRGKWEVDFMEEAHAVIAECRVYRERYVFNSFHVDAVVPSTDVPF